MDGRKDTEAPSNVIDHFVGWIGVITSRRQPHAHKWIAVAYSIDT
jgi:hypothetical protein